MRQNLTGCYKLISRILFQHYHLSVPKVTDRDQAAYPPTSGEPPSSVGIRGISACKVYPPCTLPYKAVGSYPTFSPLSADGGRLFSAALSVSTSVLPPGTTRLFTGALPCAVRTFLPCLSTSAIVRFVANTKIALFKEL